MLVLSRYKSESIVITSTSGETITIMVTDVRGKQILANGTTCRPRVKIGIDAPRDWSVHRAEVQKLINGENSSNAPGEKQE